MTTTAIVEGNKTINSRKQLSQIIDTTLLKCYLEVGIDTTLLKRYLEVGSIVVTYNVWLALSVLNVGFVTLLYHAALCNTNNDNNSVSPLLCGFIICDFYRACHALCVMCAA